MEIKILVDVVDATDKSQLIRVSKVLVKDCIPNNLEAALFFAHESFRPGYVLERTADKDGFFEVIRGDIREGFEEDKQLTYSNKL
jgi:hypothetical protein